MQPDLSSSIGPSKLENKSFKAGTGTASLESARLQLLLYIVYSIVYRRAIASASVLSFIV